MTRTSPLKPTQSFSQFQTDQQVDTRNENCTSQLFQAIIVTNQPSETIKKFKIAKRTVRTDKKPNAETTFPNITRSGHFLDGEEIIALMRALEFPTFSVNELRGIDDTPDELSYTQNLVQYFTSKKQEYEKDLLDEGKNEIYIKIFKDETITGLFLSKLNNEENFTRDDHTQLATQLLENEEFEKFIAAHLKTVTENKHQSNQKNKENILNWVNGSNEAIQPFVLVSEKNVGVAQNPEEAISKALRLEFEFMKNCEKSLTPRTFFIISNNDNHWLASRCAITPNDENRMNISLTTVDSLEEMSETFSFESKGEFFSGISLPDSYEWAQREYIKTAQQKGDEGGELSTCGIRAAFNVSLMSIPLNQEVEPGQLGEIAPSETILRHIAGQILQDPSKSLKALVENHSEKKETVSPSPAQASFNESNFDKEKDLNVLHEMLAILVECESKKEIASNALNRIASLCGGASGISYKDNNPFCIRNRYGRERTIEPKGFINFSLLYRAFMVLKAGIPAPLEIDSDLIKLKSKVTYILEKETNHKTSNPFAGNTEDLSVIYQFVKDHYYDVSISRIKSELHSLLGLTIENKEDLYFFGRKMIVIGELCHEIEKDLGDVQDNEVNSDRLKKSLETFKAINKERNNFVHPRALVKQFLESDQGSELKSKLYAVVQKSFEFFDVPKIGEILKTALSTREITEKGSKQKRRKVKPSTLIEKTLRKSDEYARLLDECRIKENQLLSAKEQRLITIGTTLEVDKLINIGNKLNIFRHVNNLKMLRVKLTHKFNMEDIRYRECFNAAVGTNPFDITSLEDCTSLLKKIATFKTNRKRKKTWKAKEKSDQSLIQVLASSCSTYVIKNPRKLQSRKKELKDERKMLIEKIDEEINFVYQVNRDLEMDSQKKRAIKEYVVTIVGQYMRELGEVSVLEHTLLSQIALEAGETMRTLRSKGLAHEILSFDSDQFERTFKEIILPAKSDFNAIHIIYHADQVGSVGMHLALGQAYDRLHLQEEAIDQFRKAIDYIEHQPVAFREELAKHTEPQTLSDENFYLAANVALIIATTYFVGICNGQCNYKDSLEAIDKISSHFDELVAFEYSELNDSIATLHMRRGECLYYADARNLKEVVSAYSIAFQLASDPSLKIGFLIGAADRAYKSMRDFRFSDIKTINTIRKCINQVKWREVESFYYKYKLLEIQLSFLTTKEDAFNQTYRELHNFLCDHKVELKKELGDKANLIIFDTIRIKLDQIEASQDYSKLEEIYDEFKLEYEKLEKLNLHKDIKVTCCAHHLSDLIRRLLENNSADILLNKYHELLDKSSQCLRWAKNGQRESDVKALADSLAYAYFNLRKHGSDFQKKALALGREYSLELTEIKKMVKADINYQLATDHEDPEKAIFYYSQAIKCLKSLEHIDAENQKNIETCKEKRSEILIAKITSIILSTYQSKKEPTKGELVIEFSKNIYSLKTLNRYCIHLKLAGKPEIKGDFIRILLPIADLEKVIIKTRNILAKINSK